MSWAPAGITTRPRRGARISYFLKGVELLIHDAMYTPAELEQHAGWGHSTYAEAVAVAADAGVSRLVLFHHEPEHDDAGVDALVAQARTEAKNRGRPGQVPAAQERMQRTPLT